MNFSYTSALHSLFHSAFHSSFHSVFHAAFHSPLPSLFLLLFSLPSFATTWNVGPTRTYTMPSELVSLVQDGDTVSIDAGTYAGDRCDWTKHRLVLRAVDGEVILDAKDVGVGRFGMWTLGGSDCTVEGITFTNFVSTRTASAALHVAGRGVSIRNCVFRQNNNGVLVLSNKDSRVVIEGCEFDANGQNDGSLGSVYVFAVTSLVFRANYCHGTLYGGQVRSQASFNWIEYNRFTTSISRANDRVLDFENGGFGLVLGNIFEQGVSSFGQVVIGFGLGGLVHQCQLRSTDLYINFNTFICRDNNTTVVRVANNTRWVIMPSNIYVNVSKILVGDPRVRDTTRGVRVTDVSQVGFVDAARGDYHLRDDAIARLKSAAENGWHDNDCEDWPHDRIATRPYYQYRHPRSLEVRAHGFDCGAYESYASTDVLPETPHSNDFLVAPNPASASITLSLPPSLIGSDVVIMNMQGSEVARYTAMQTSMQIDVRSMSAGVYSVRCGSYRSLIHLIP